MLKSRTLIALCKTVFLPDNGNGYDNGGEPGPLPEEQSGEIEFGTAGGSCPSSVRVFLKTPAKLQNIDNKPNNNVVHDYRL